ncbi:MAG: FAD-binding oxidoreductase [Bacteroidetes bacterium]|nr:MAG: FAD-binding oxidoreductase [Bacteroidota bacterium]
MDLRSYYPYWLLDKSIPAIYPSLLQNITADVTIIGAGISGAIAAWYLRNSSEKVLVVDRRHAGMGSTAASTGLLQYEIDTPLARLQTLVGISNANKSYILCSQAITELTKICRRFPASEFEMRPSLQYASSLRDAGCLRKEFELRKKIGIDLELLDEREIKSRFGFSKSAGLLSKNAAEVNAFGLTHSLLQYCSGKNAEVYDHTGIKGIRRVKKQFELFTANGVRIKTRKIIIACGYESKKYLPRKFDQLHTTYAVVTEPVAREALWYNKAVIWETSSPYLYIRTTRDNRILVGGKDDDFSGSFKRDKAMPRKAKMLAHSFSKLFPHIPFIIDYNWAGAFGSTKDGLPYIGELAGKPNIYFALGFGGNGILFSVIAGQIIRDLIYEKKNEHADIFNFSR